MFGAEEIYFRLIHAVFPGLERLSLVRGQECLAKLLVAVYRQEQRHGRGVLDQTFDVVDHDEHTPVLRDRGELAVGKQLLQRLIHLVVDRGNVVRQGRLEHRGEPFANSTDAVDLHNDRRFRRIRERECLPGIGRDRGRSGGNRGEHRDRADSKCDANKQGHGVTS